MTTAATSLLGLALPVTGELSGTWGDTVNNSITSLLDSAIAGTTTVSTDADVTLTTTTLAANQAREAILLFSGARTALRNVTAPAQSKIYTVINATTGGFSVVLRGAGPTTGVTILAGESAVCAWNGSDFIKISNTAGAGTFTSLTVSGTTAFNGNTTIGDAAADSLTVNATIGSNLIFTDNTYDIGASGATRPRTLYLGTSLITPAITNSGLTTGRVVYTTTGGLETSSANLLYSGTDLTVYGITVGRGAGAVSSNTAVGASALAANTTGNYSSAFGDRALTQNTTGATNAAVGSLALYSNTTGSNNASLGYAALYGNTTGGSNTAVGREALQANTTASNNTAVGYQAGYANTTGGITAFGYLAGNANTTGLYNTAVGSNALQTNTTGSGNTMVGLQAGYSTTGNYNTFVGFSSTDYGSGQLVTTGTKNTILGGFSGNQAGLDIRTLSNTVVLSDGDGNPRFITNSSGGSSAEYSLGSGRNASVTIPGITNGYSANMMMSKPGTASGSLMTAQFTIKYYQAINGWESSNLAIYVSSTQGGATNATGAWYFYRVMHYDTNWGLTLVDSSSTSGHYTITASSPGSGYNTQKTVTLTITSLYNSDNMAVQIFYAEPTGVFSIT